MERWPDVVPAVVRYLSYALSLPPGRVATKVPSNVETLDGFVRVVRGPGSDDGVTDSFLLDVETFTKASQPSQAWGLAEDVRAAMHGLPDSVLLGPLVDSVTTSSAPAEVDYGNPKTVRYVASYRLRLRKVFDF